MRPIKLTIKHFGPFAGTEVIDFEKFSNEGLFLINGQTGSGKTSILDAMTFAIYGEVQGLRGKPVNNKALAVRLKSDYTDSTVTPQVILDADINGTTYRFTRSPKFRKDGNTTDTQATATLEKFDGTTWTSIAQKPEDVGRETLQILGLSKDQFSQLVLLPQGGFQTFLNARNDAKAEILSELFPAHTYQTIIDWIKLQRNNAVKELDVIEGKRRELEARLRQATDDETLALSEKALEEHLDSSVNSHNGLQDLLADHVLLVDGLTAKLAQATAGQAAFNLIEQARLEITNEEFKLSEMQDSLNAMGLVNPTLASLGEALAKAHQAVATLEQDLANFDNLQTKEQVLAAQILTLEELQDTAQISSNQLRELEQKQTDIAKHIADNSSLDADKVQLDQVIFGLNTHKNQLIEIEILKEQRQLALELQQSCVEAYQEALQSSITILETYQQDLAASLAQGLISGEACLVCGSKEHPSPALPKPGAPSKADVDLSSTNAESARESLEDAKRKVLVGDAQIQTLTDKLPDHSKLDAVLERISERESALKALNEKLTILEEKNKESKETAISIDQHKARITELLQEIQNARSGIDQNTGAITQAKQALSGKSKTETEESLVLAKNQLQSLSLLLPAFEDSTNKIQLAKATIEANKLAAQSKIDDFDALQDQTNSANLKLVSIRAEETRMSDQITAIRDITQKFNQLQESNAKAEKVAEQWRNLHAYTSGEAGRGIDLPTFYLSYRLKQVVNAANHRLQAMTDGRYKFIHDVYVAAANGARSGLAIMVVDSNTGQTRGPESLSGGELFIASLSLALGLSDIVSAEAGGRRLQALFVDEGFGSLDSETLDLVMDSLDELRAAGRMVGLVSHVESMKSRVPAQIVVKKTNRGSTLQLVGV